MEEGSEPLTGGNVAGAVIRVGATVRKAASRASFDVRSLLDHVHAQGCVAAPCCLGVDEAGRQMLEYIPGVVCSAGRALGLEELREIGATIRKLHEALASFRARASAEWHCLMAPDGKEILCHNDLAPWNLIRASGARGWVFIDWDEAGPGTRLWDLAYAALTFPPIEPGCDLAVAAPRLGALLEGYRLERAEYGALLFLLVKRARAMEDLLVAGSRSGQEPWARLYAAGHASYWGPVADYVGRNLRKFTELLT